MSPHLSLTIQEMCSTGSFAEIYRANYHSGEQRKPIALKILKDKWLQDQEQLNRFWDEAQLLTHLNHAHIVKANGICEINGLPAIIMDFIDGYDLKYLLENPNFQFSSKMAFEIASTIAKTLDDVYYHSQNQLGENLAVLHRDIKPSNIMINRHALVQVLDFGASRFENSGREAETNAYEPGTQKYSSPDRRLGTKGNHKGDIFAVGLLLIEMLENRLLPMPPLKVEDYQQFLADHIENLKFSMPNEQWDQSVKDTLYRMCSYDPNNHLNAKQAVHMLSPYAKRAQTQSLQQNVQTYFPQCQRQPKQGQWSGQKISVQMLHSLNTPTNSLDPEQSTKSLRPSDIFQDKTENSVPKPQATIQAKERIFSHPVFWRNFAISAAAIFIVLHGLTWFIRSLNTPSESIKPTELVTETAPIAMELFSLNVSKTDLATIDIFDSEEESSGRLTRSKSQKDFSLPKGTYQLSIKIFNHSEPHTDFSFSLKKDAELLCSLQNDKPICRLNGKKL